jgi:molybdopterin-guanine dinucleotide biosynthesis protein
VERLGHHTKIELPSGRRAQLYVDDEIVVTYGDRYAPDQFEAEVPLSLSRTCLVASGGIAASVLTKSGAVRRATEISPIGLIGDRFGQPLNISRYRLPAEPSFTSRPRTLAVFGTSMNSGKTTTVSQLVHGLRRAGRLPGATKVTGTGSGNDYWSVLDAGAHVMVDFTDAGLASTYRIPFDVVEATFADLLDHLANCGCTDIVVEVADGLYQRETMQLARSEVFRHYVDHVVFAAGEAMGAVAGLAELRSLGLPVVALSGLLTRAPLAHREASAHVDVPILTRDQLADPRVAVALMLGDPAAVRDAVALVPTVEEPASLEPPAGAEAPRQPVPVGAGVDLAPSRNGSA